MSTSRYRNLNRKLLVSVFNAQEAREAVLGGGRIIDSEDPKSALGNISPRKIMDVSDAVLDCKRDLEIQLSTNIGEDQLLFRRAQTGQAIEKSPYEIAGKAAQAALGVALSMGTRVHPVNLVKVGVDGMDVSKVGEVLSEVVQTIRRTEHLSHCAVMSVLFAQNLTTWLERKNISVVRKTLVELREFNPSDPDKEGAFDIVPFALEALKDLKTGKPLFSKDDEVNLASLIQKGVLPSDQQYTFVHVNELFEHGMYFPNVTKGESRTTQSVIKAMVDVTADSGANAIMLDTSILSKVSNICLVDTSPTPKVSRPMIDTNKLMARDGMNLQGILTLDDLNFFVEYCHYRGLAANLAGSIDSHQAQQLWLLLPELDQVSTRGSASGVSLDPSDDRVKGEDTRQRRVIKRTLVRGLAAPEHGGVLNIPSSLSSSPAAKPRLRELIALLRELRQEQGQPELPVFWVDPYGKPSPVSEKDLA